MKHLRFLYLIADGGRARFVKQDEVGHYVTDQEFEFADIHSQARDLRADKPGRTFGTTGSAHHAVQPRTDPHDANKASFAHGVAQALIQAERDGGFDRLVLVAPAHILAEIEGALDAATADKITDTLQKDLTHVPDAELPGHLADVKRY